MNKFHEPNKEKGERKGTGGGKETISGSVAMKMSLHLTKEIGNPHPSDTR